MSKFVTPRVRVRKGQTVPLPEPISPVNVDDEVPVEVTVSEPEIEETKPSDTKPKKKWLR